MHASLSQEEITGEGRTGNAGKDRAEAGQVVADQHGANQAVVTLRVLNAHLILDHESRRGHIDGEAEEHLHRITCSAPPERA